MKEYIKSIECYNKSLAISTKLNNNVNIANSLESIGNIYLQLKVYDKSYDYLIKSIKISREIGAKNILKTALYDLHIVNENRGKYNESLNNLKEFYLIRDSIYNFESNLKMAQLDFKYKEDKKDKEIEFFKMSDDKQKADLKAKSLTIYFSIGGFVLVSLLAFFIFTRFQIKKKSNIELESKNAQIEDQNIELLALNEDMLEQKRIVELAHYQLSEKNEEVLSSIRYAQKIQIAILPFESTIKKHINEFFIIFKPKDIISGDFYWYNETNDQIYLAVADCTGHGVPGSMLSMIGAMIMNEAIQKEIYTLNGILNYLNNTFNNALSNSNSELETSDLRDGMDVCLISIDKITKKVSFSGANRPLYYITDGQIKEIKGTRKSIGGKIRNQNEFEVFDIEFSNNSYFYLSSDGYADQGNEYSKKLSTKILKEEILKIHQQDLNNQKEHLINLFEEHKSNAEQRDDVTLIGIKLKD